MAVIEGGAYTHAGRASLTDAPPASSLRCPPLQLYCLVERKVKGDGNCMFRALSDQLYRSVEGARDGAVLGAALSKRRAGQQGARAGLGRSPPTRCVLAHSRSARSTPRLHAWVRECVVRQLRQHPEKYRWVGWVQGGPHALLWWASAGAPAG